MKPQLQVIVDKLHKLIETAADRADSDNEKTAEKYADIPDLLEEAVSQIEEAISQLEA